jgi:hypothetical protein
VIKDQSEQLDHKVCKVLQDQLDRKVLKEFKVLLDWMVKLF